MPTLLTAILATLLLSNPHDEPLQVLIQGRVVATVGARATGCVVFVDPPGRSLRLELRHGVGEGALVEMPLSLTTSWESRWTPDKQRVALRPRAGHCTVETEPAAPRAAATR